jgi:flagellar biosynthetic protein FliQ
MTDVQVLDIVKDAFMLALKVAGPILGVALVIGVTISILQTITQVQEMTLTFVPKLVGAGLIVLFGGRWMLSELVSWASRLWEIIPTLR